MSIRFFTLLGLIVSLTWMLPAIAGAGEPIINTPLVIRLSPEAVMRTRTKEFHKISPVNDVILGTPVHGTSHTHGTYCLTPANTDECGALLVNVDGTSVSKTTGTTRPVSIFSTATTKFHADTKITFSEGSFSKGPIQVDATTAVRTDGIDSRRGGLVGRMVRNAASRRVAESKPASTEISRQRAIKRVEQAVEQRVDERVAQLNGSLTRVKTVVAMLDPDMKRPLLVSASEDALVIAFAPKGAETVDRDSLSSLPPMDADCEVWLHEKALRPELAQRLAVYARAHTAAQSFVESARRVFTAAPATATAPAVPEAFFTRHGDWLLVKIENIEGIVNQPAVQPVSAEVPAR